MYIFSIITYLSLGLAIKYHPGWYFPAGIAMYFFSFGIRFFIGFLSFILPIILFGLAVAHLLRLVGDLRRSILIVALS